MATTDVSAHEQHPHQQHPVSLYLTVWGLLFVLSTLSYLVDYFRFVGYLRWGLIIAFMLLKAGLIVAFFMHMRWERLSLIYAILLPPLCLLVLVGLMQTEAGYTYATRTRFFVTPDEQTQLQVHPDRLHAPGGTPPLHENPSQGESAQ